MNIKLIIIRIVFIISSWIMYQVTRKKRFFWLYWYMKGSGQNLHLPTELVPIEDMILYRHSGCRWGYSLTHRGYKYLLHDTTMYDGYGFWGRPESFYLVGGMTYQIDFQRNSIHISGVDHYDWHSNKDGEYYTSPMPYWITWLFNKVLGEKYFPLDGFPMGEPGISNFLFKEMQKVGAKPFDTVIDVTISNTEYRRMKRLLKRRGGASK